MEERHRADWSVLCLQISSYTMCLTNGWSGTTRRLSFADAGLVQGCTEEKALIMEEVLGARFKECKLKLHPEKTRVIYCKDGDRRRKHLHTSRPYLGSLLSKIDENIFKGY